MNLLCKCEKPIYFQSVVNMIQPKVWKRETAVYCDCGSIINVKLKKYFSEKDYRIYNKYDGREIYTSIFSLDKYDIKLICQCGMPVIFTGNYKIDKDKIVRIICSKCKSLYEIMFKYYSNFNEFELSKKVKILLSPKPSINTIDSKNSEKELIIENWRIKQ